MKRKACEFVNQETLPESQLRDEEIEKLKTENARLKTCAELLNEPLKQAELDEMIRRLESWNYAVTKRSESPPVASTEIDEEKVQDLIEGLRTLDKALRMQQNVIAPGYAFVGESYCQRAADLIETLCASHLQTGDETAESAEEQACVCDETSVRNCPEHAEEGRGE